MISSGQTDMVELLLEYACDVNVRNDQGWTPLHEASSARMEEIVGLLLNSGANPNLQDEHGKCLFSY